MMTDPFAVLGVDGYAGDEEIKQRYLALVRAFPPERAPQRFQEIRAAFEALRTERDRLRHRLLNPGSAALTRLKRACLTVEPPSPARRASRATVAALLLAGVTEVALDPENRKE